MRDNQYLLVECKNQVDQNRPHINKAEMGQINNSCAWFKNNYAGTNSHNIIIIWTRTVNSSAGFNEQVYVMTAKKLERLVKNVRGFFTEFKTVDLQSIAEAKLQANLVAYHLTVDTLLTEYAELPQQLT